MQWGNAGIALSLSLGLLGSSLGGTLGSFEESVAKPVPRSDRDQHDDCDDGRDCIFAGEVGEFVFISMAAVVYGTYRGVKYLAYDWWARPDGISYEAEANEVEAPSFSSEKAIVDVSVEDRSSESEHRAEEALRVDEGQPAAAVSGLTHEVGTAGLPYLRFDYRWQYLDSDLDANDFLLEVGYQYAALYARFTRYEDRAAKEDLDIEQYYGLFRMGGSDEFFFSGYFQIGLGAGGYIIKGDREQSGAALTVPILVYPCDYFGIEFRPAWARINNKTISDYDISVSAGQRFIQLRTGYRWLWVQGEGHWLNGPYAGVSLSF